MKNLIITILFLLPITVSAQLLRSYGVLEIGTTFPTSTSTGAKFAYRTVDSSFYRWVSGSTWVKVIPDGSSGGSDTLYLKQLSGTTALVNGDTIDISTYLLKADTASMLTPYIKLAGYGLSKLTTGTLNVDTSLISTKVYTNRFLLKSDTTSAFASYLKRPVGWGLSLLTGKYPLVDSSKVSSRYYVGTNPTTIAANSTIRSNGSNLVAGNITDNGTRLISGLPFQLKEYSLAGLPTGTTKDMYWVTGSGLAWYQGSRLAYGLESTFARGTATRIPFFDANGQIIDGSGLTYTSSRTLMVGTTSAVSTATPARLSTGGTFSSTANANLKLLVYDDGSNFWGWGVSSGLTYFNAPNYRFNNQTGGSVLGQLDATGFGIGKTPTSALDIINTNGGVAGGIKIKNTSTGVLGYASVYLESANGENSQFFSTNSTYTGYRAISASSFGHYSSAANGMAIQLDGATAALRVGIGVNEITRTTTTGFGIFKTAPDYILDATSTNAYGLPRGTVAQRPTIVSSTTPFRYNTDSTALEYGESVGTWRQLATRAYARTMKDGNGIYTGSGTLASSITRPLISPNNKLLFTQLYNGGIDSSYLHFSNSDLDGERSVIMGITDSSYVGGLAEIALRKVSSIGRMDITMQAIDVGGSAQFEVRGSEGISASAGASGFNTNTEKIELTANEGRVTLRADTDQDPATGDASLNLERNNVFIKELFNSNTDSAYFEILNYFDGARQVAFGITDTVGTGNVYANFNSNGDGTMGFEIESVGTDGRVTIRSSEGALNMSTDSSNISMSVQEGSEILLFGLLRANRESYHRVTSTTSPDTLSSVYSDNIVDQGSTQATFTLAMPSNPQDGQICTITYVNAITTLTLDGNGETIVGSAVTTGVPGSQRKFKYCGTCTTPAWIKIY